MKKESIEKSTYRAIVGELLRLAISKHNPKDYYKNYRTKSQRYKIEETVLSLYRTLTLLSLFIIKENKVTKKINLENYKQRKDLLGIIARCDTLMETCYTPALKFLLSFFEGIKDYTIKTNYLLPRNLRKDFEEMFMLSIYLFIKSGYHADLEDEILKFKFIHSKLQKSKIPPSEASVTTHGKDIRDDTNLRATIIFTNLEIDNKKAKYISKLLSSPMAQHYVYMIAFGACRITGKFDMGETIYTHLYFYKCKVDSDIKFPKYAAGPIVFRESVVSKKISFDSTSLYGNFIIEDCHFLTASVLKMKQMTFLRKGSVFAIENSVFGGNINILNVDALYAKTVIENVKVEGNFSFFNLYIDQLSYIANVSAKNSMNIVSQLKKCRFGADYIIDEKRIKFSKDKNPDIETQTNWYPPKKAAEYIGRSVIFLAKRRKRDRIKTEKDSIPFLGEYKSIVYPKDALDAYMAKDYQKLQELRERYNFIKN